MILTKAQALQIARQAEQHFMLFTESMREAAMHNQLESRLVRLLDEEGFNAIRHIDSPLIVDIIVPNSDGTQTVIQYKDGWKVKVDNVLSKVRKVR